MNGIVIFKSKYGATRQYAEWIGTSLNLPVHSQDSIRNEDLPLYDLVIIGSSVYMGKLLIKKWIRQNIGDLESKMLFLFIVCGTGEHETEIRQSIIDENIPPSLQKGINIFFLPGRVIKNKLTWVDRFFLKMGTWLEKDPARKKAMSEDMDAVKKENIKKMLMVIETLTSKIDVAPANQISV